MTVGLLHTSPVHVAPFDALLERAAPGTAAVHAVDESLLADARRLGPESVGQRVAAAVHDLVGRGASVVVCTCSTVGPVAESCASPVPVLRVDRPAAVRAGALARTRGGAVGVVVAVESTVEPTRALLTSVTDAHLEVVLADGAWARFESGDVPGYLRLVEEEARALAPRVAVVLLAQASMAAAAGRLGDVGVPVLSTPATAVDEALRLLAARD